MVVHFQWNLVVLRKLTLKELKLLHEQHTVERKLIVRRSGQQSITTSGNWMSRQGCWRFGNVFKSFLSITIIWISLGFRQNYDFFATFVGITITQLKMTIAVASNYDLVCADNKSCCHELGTKPILVHSGLTGYSAENLKRTWQE